MSGLLVKDFRLIRGQARTLLIMLVMGVGCMLAADNVQFMMAYFVIFAVSFSTGTISYDEFDNGFHYLFTLPITRKLYAREKYVFGISVVTVFGIAAILLTIAAQIMTGRGGAFRVSEFAASALAFLWIGYVMLAFMLPVYIKYGAEKGRIAAMLVYAGVAALVLIPVYLANKLGADLTGIAGSMINLPRAALALTALVILAAALAVSLKISYRIIEKKEF